MVKKYINTTINMTLYPEKDMIFACGSGWQKLLGYCELVGRGLSEIRKKVVFTLCNP